ncbi:MAG TPA: type IV pilus assembly protein PilM, partial [Solirubrobacterales bacterium]|nr:type IV pilus assembly protein PilM [Solirubrobacterales bacterium]
KDSALVGLEIEADSIAAVEVDAGGSTPLSGTAIVPLAPGAFHDGEVTDPAALCSALKGLFSQHKLSRRVRLGIANQKVVVRTLRLPAIDDPKELEMAVRSQAQEQIPMPLEQAVLDHRVVGGVAEVDGMAPQIDVVVVAARRDMIEATLKPLEDAGLEPVGVDLSAFGLIRALSEPAKGEDGSAPEPSNTATLYCNVGDATNLAIAKGKSCLFTRVSPAGLEDVAASLAASAGLTEEHARMWLTHVGLAEPVETIEGDPEIVARARGALEGGASAVLDELRLSLDFYGAQEAAAPVDRVVVGGPGGALPGFAEWMAPILGLPISSGFPSALAGMDPAAAARLTLPYGLALDG